MRNRGRPRSVDDEVIGRLIGFGVKPGVVALVFGVHPKTVTRARRRFVEEIEPTIARLRGVLERIAGHHCRCKIVEDGEECAACVARAGLEVTT